MFIFHKALSPLGGMLSSNTQQTADAALAALLPSKIVREVTTGRFLTVDPPALNAPWTLAHPSGSGKVSSRSLLLTVDGRMA